MAGLRIIVNAMLRAIKMLLEVVLMTVFCLLVFSLVSVQIYKGSLRQKCVVDPGLLVHKQKPNENYANFYRRMLRDESRCTFFVVESYEKMFLCNDQSSASSEVICLKVNLLNWLFPIACNLKIVFFLVPVLKSAFVTLMSNTSPCYDDGLACQFNTARTLTSQFSWTL